MSDEQKILKYLMEIFPVVGQSEGKPLIEMKFKMQVSPEEEMMEKLHEIIEQLKDDEVLTEYEFANTINYKARKEIPIALGAGGGAPPATNVGGKELQKLVIALAEASDDPSVKEALSAYKESL